MSRSFFANWIRQNSVRRPSPRKRADCPPSLEPLEDRTLLSGATLADDYVMKLYKDVLTRPVDASTEAIFSAGLNAGTLSCPQIAGFVVGSAEYHGIEVGAAYKTVLGRAADPSSSAWVTFLNSGGTDVQLKAQLYGTGEFYAAHGSTPTGFVNALYQSILGRAADSSASNWVNLVTMGVPRAAVAGTFLVTAEAESITLTAFFKTFLGRAPQSAELQLDINALARGTSYEQLLSGLVSSPEYQKLAGGDLNQAYVMQLFPSLLGRPPSTSELSNFTAFLDGGAPRAQAVANIMASPEYIQKHAGDLLGQFLPGPVNPTLLKNIVAALQQGASDEAIGVFLASTSQFFQQNGNTNTGFVSALYQIALHRSPSDAELNGWLGALQSGTTTSTVAQIILTSHEYHTVLVNTDFQMFLNRQADPNSQNAFAAALDAGLKDQAVIAILTTSAEYYVNATPALP